jgi:FkbM family methyltransferase
MKLKINGMAAFYAVVAVLCAVPYCRGEGGGCNCPSSKFENGAYFSQFYEDYILGYVFKIVKKGFYIDVGANDPNTDNVTRYFYERGWNGINIEPNVGLFKKIVRSRPRDSNYNIGISDKEGTMPFYQETDSTYREGLSTFDKKNAEKLKNEKKVQFKEIPVPLTTLNNILAKLSIPEITFINIDVEGFEKQVIESIDLVKYKPLALCIEATQPMTDIPSYMEWEKILLKNNYTFAMYDGLNRYYVHKEHADLLPRFIDIDRCVKKSKYTRKVKVDGRDPW